MSRLFAWCILFTILFSSFVFVQDKKSVSENLRGFLQKGDTEPKVESKDLAQVLTLTLNGGAISKGVGLRGVGTGTITLSGIPDGSTIRNAVLYWTVLADVSPGPTAGFSSPVVRGIQVPGVPLGQSASPCWPECCSFSFRADVTGFVSGNGDYTIQIPDSGNFLVGPSVEGASLVVVFENPALPKTTFVLAEGHDLLINSRVDTMLSGFTAPEGVAKATVTYIVGDGQGVFQILPSNSFTIDAAKNVLFNGQILSVNNLIDSNGAILNGSDGAMWDTQTFDVTSLVSPGATSVTASIDATHAGTGASHVDCIVWVACVFQVQEKEFKVHPEVMLTASGGIDSPDRDPDEKTRVVTQRINIIPFPKDPDKDINLRLDNIPDTYPQLSNDVLKKAFSFEIVNKQYVRINIKEDLPEGASIGWDVRVKDKTVGKVRMFIPPQRLIQMVMGEAVGEMELEIGGKGRQRVTNDAKQILSPTAIALTWSVRNRVEELVAEHFDPGFFGAKARSYQGVLIPKQYNGLESDVSNFSNTRDRLKKFKGGKFLPEYDLSVESVATTFGYGLLQQRPLEATRNGVVGKNEKCYWFQSPDEKQSNVIINALKNNRIGDARKLEKGLFNFVLNEIIKIRRRPPKIIPRPVQIFYFDQFKFLNKDAKGFVFGRLMVDVKNEKTVLLENKITGN